MIEPSVDFQFPAEHGDEEIIEAREQGRVQGERLAWRLLMEFVAGARNPKLRLAAFEYVQNPDAKTIREIATELGLSHMTVHREIAKVRSFRLPRDVTACLG